MVAPDKVSLLGKDCLVRSVGKCSRTLSKTVKKGPRMLFSGNMVVGRTWSAKDKVLSSDMAISISWVSAGEKGLCWPVHS